MAGKRSESVGAEEPAAELVKVIANPAIFRSRGQVKLSVEGAEYLIRNDQALEVSREVYEQMRKVDVRGRQAVVLV